VAHSILTDFASGAESAYEEAKRGRLRLTKCGRKTLVTLDDAEAWLASLPKVGGEVPE
jgi:hypothetical protein